MIKSLRNEKLEKGQVVHFEYKGNYYPAVVEGFWYKGEVVEKDVAPLHVRVFSGLVVKGTSDEYKDVRLNVNRCQLYRM